MSLSICRFSPHFSTLFLAILVLITAGCSQSFNIKNLAKSDIDMVADTYIQELYIHSRELMIKLYKRNPRELQKTPGLTLEDRLLQLPRFRTYFRFPELDNKMENAALQLAFDESFRGDRVFALIVGIRSTLHASYNQQVEFFLLDELDQQKLYNSARNLEVIAWRLNSFKQPDGSLFLLSNGYQNGIPNLSFERLFGKMISLQDMMAKIVAGKKDRAINTVVHGVASTALIPIGI